MKVTSRLALGLIAVLVSVPAWAQEQAAKSVDEQFQAIAAARTRAELAVRKNALAFDDGRNGWRDAWSNLDRSFQRIQQTYQKAIQTEQARGEELRNPATIEDFNLRLRESQEEWQGAQKERQAIDVRYREAQGRFQNASQVYNNLVNIERAWKDARMDLAVLQASFELAAKALESAVEEGQAALAAMQQMDKDWQTKLAGAAAAAGQG